MEDVLVAVPDLPTRGGHTWAEPLARGNGGTGLNVLRATAALGSAPLSALAVGTGPRGTRIAQELDALGLTDGAPTLLPLHREDNGTCLTLLTPDGERTFITTPGCEMDWSATRLSALNTALDAALPRALAAQGARRPVVYASGFQLLAVGHHLLTWLEGLEATVVIDPGGRVGDLAANADVRERFLARADILALNEEEADVLLGARCRPEALAALATQTRTDIVLRQGSDGATWLPADGGRLLTEPAVPVEVVDTDGAGDAHTAGILVGTARQLSPERVLRLANQSAARVVAGRGPQGLPVNRRPGGSA